MPNSNFPALPADTAERSVTLAYVGLSLTMLAWSLVPVFLKMLLTVLTPTELSFTRFLLSGLSLLVWVLWRRPGDLVRLFREDLRLLLLSTLFGPLAAMVCFNFALRHITVGTAAVFAAIEPLCTYVLAVIIGQEIWRHARMASIILALAGITMVVLSREAVGFYYWQSLALVTLTPIIWAVNNIITKELVQRHTAVVMTAAAFVLSSLCLVPTLEPDYVLRLAGMGWALWLGMLYCLVTTVIGFTIWYGSLKFLPPSSVAVSMYIIPVISVAAGILVLGESLSWLKGAGIATVLAGLYLVNVRFR
jgi:drug/metabolite transporter (DMT)-like permease